MKNEVWNRFGLTGKFNLLSIGLVVGTALAVGSFQLNREWDDRLANLQQKGTEKAALIAQISEFAVYTEDAEMLRSIVYGALDDDTSYIGLYKADKSVLLDSSEQLATELFPNLHEQHDDSFAETKFSADARYLQVVRPIVSDQRLELEISAAEGDESSANDVVGYVRLVLNTDRQVLQFGCFTYCGNCNYTNDNVNTQNCVAGKTAESRDPKHIQGWFG